MPGRAIIEIAITNTGGTAVIDAIKSQMDALGVSVVSVKQAGDQQDKTLQNLLNSLEPARVATEKLAASQQVLKDAYDSGKISQERFSADLDALTAKYETLQTSVTGLGSTFDGLLSQLQGLATATGALAAIGGIAAGLQQLGETAASAELTDAKLTATWTANAGAADISRERLDDLAQSLSNVSGFSLVSEKQAEALGMTFHDVTGPTFERMMQAANDMAAALGTDVPSAVQKLGRALENPTAGLSALTRSGVAFTQEQKDQIKAMADSGNQMGAMNAILDQVESRYKGVAAAVGDTTSGSWDKLKNSLTALGVSIGSVLLPAASGAMQTIATTVTEGTSAFNTWKSSIETFFETLGQGAGTMAAFTMATQSLMGGTDEQLRVAAAGATSFSDQLKVMAAQSAALAQSGLNVFWEDEATGPEKAAKAYAALQAQFDPLAKATAAYNSELGALTQATSKHINLGGDYLTVLAGIKNAYAAAKDQASGLTAAVNASNAIIAAMDPMRQKTADYNASVNSLVTAVNQGKISQTDFAAALDYVTQTFATAQAGSTAYRSTITALTNELDPGAAAWDTYNKGVEDVGKWLTVAFGDGGAADKAQAMLALLQKHLQDALNPTNQFEQQVQAIAATLDESTAAEDTYNKGMAVVAQYMATVGANADLAARATLALKTALDNATQPATMKDPFANFEKSLTTSIEQGLTTGDFKKMWTSLWSDLSKDATSELTQALFGGEGPLTPKGTSMTGIFGGGSGQSITTTQGLEMGGQVVGSYLGGQGQQSGNQGEAALGGALSGAASGAMAAGWVGAIVGAVVGAAMGYFGTAAAKSYGMNFSAGTSQPPDWFTKWQMDVTSGNLFLSGGVSTGGVANSQALAQMTEQMAEKASSTQDSLNDLLVLLKQTPNLNPQWSATLGGSSSDVSTAFNQFLNNTMPQAIFTAFTGSLQTGLEDLGVSADRAKSELEAVANASDFSTAIANLKAYVQALLDFGTITTDLQKPLAQLIADAGQGQVATWAQNLATTQTSIQGILADFSSLSSTDQVTAAQNAISLINSQIAANQQLMASLVSLSTSITNSIQTIFNNISLQAAEQVGGGAEQAFLTGKFNQSLAAVGTSTTSEDLQTNMTALENWGNQLLSLANTMEQMLPQFDTLSATFATLNDDLTTGFGQTIADFGKTTLQALNDTTQSTISQINALRLGLDDMTSAQQITNLTEIGQLAQQQYASNIQELQNILSLTQSIGTSITSMMGNWALQDAEKQGPQAEGNYLVQQIMQAYGQLQAGGNSPEQVQNLTQEITSLADTLHGLSGSINLTQNGQAINVTTWLDQLMESVNTLAQQQLGGAANAIQTANQQLESAISGLSQDIVDQKGNLQNAINGIISLVQGGLGGALSTAQGDITSWENQIVAANAALLSEVQQFVSALTTLTGAVDSAANQITGDNQSGSSGGGGGGSSPGGGTGTKDAGTDAMSASVLQFYSSLPSASARLGDLTEAAKDLARVHQDAAAAASAFTETIQVAGATLAGAASTFQAIVAQAAATARVAGWA
ncbi:MAG: hypothetical protein ABR961_03385 [Thermoanaerobaculaceae bacterium]|jgi:tetrahydromethanopterin S-methyltransferase subunit B